MRLSKKRRLASPSKDIVQNGCESLCDSGGESSNFNSYQSYLTNSLAGKIESLHVINFMCHSNLEITFNKRITFVTGKNGSGKSTILAAVIAVLGGAANSTGRGCGMTDFIKKGENWAEISITLNNEGINSFKKDTYGNQIIIKRVFSKNATSSYTCKSESGEIISKKKEEVEKICTALDLQIKNPVCILTQDVARSFLSSTDNSIRYTMFMKATHLENLKLILSDTLDLLLSSQKELDKKKVCIKNASKEIEHLKEKLAYFASLEKYVNEKTALENEYIWSLVSAEEKTLQELINSKAKIEESKNKFIENQSNFQNVIDKLEDVIKEIDDKLAELRKKINEEKMKRKDLMVEVQNFQHQIDSANSCLNQMEVKNQRYQCDINSIKEHLKMHEDIASTNKLEKEKITEKMNKLLQDLAELRLRINTAKRDTENGQETKIQYTMALEGLRSNINELERNKKQLELQLGNANERGNSNLLKYGPFTPRLKQLIEEAAKRNQFHKVPVGPCGSYITLTGDSKWARAVESVVGGLMNTYCCDNRKDFEVLTRLMSQVCKGKHPPIIISPFQQSRHDVSSQKVFAPGVSSVLDVLTFSNDVVFNTFIDQTRFETILLFESDEQAASLMSHVENVPKNLRMGLTIQTDKYFPAPNYRTYYGDNTKPLKYFDVISKSKEAKEKVEGQIRMSQLTIDEKKTEIKEINGKLQKIMEFLSKSENNLKLLKHNERKLESQINEIKSEEESQPVLPTRVVLEEELKALDKNQEEIKKSILIEKEKVDKLSADKEICVGKLGLITNEEQNLQKEINNLEKQIEDSKYQLKLEKDKKKNYNKIIKEKELELDKVREEISNTETSLENKTKAANEIHPERINTARSPIEVQKLLEKCEKYLQAAEKKFESREVIINEYKMKNHKYKDMRKAVETLEKIVVSLSEIAISKDSRFRLLQSHTANLVSFHFQACLQTRGYDGHLKFNFQKQDLDIEVTAKDGIPRKDAKSLSGGERSYSTVSFILALWRAVQMPFYFLDEFDVFMDKVNRKVILDLLLEHAKGQSKMQFVFITPQDMSCVEASDIISVYQMPAPVKEKG